MKLPLGKRVRQKRMQLSRRQQTITSTDKNTRIPRWLLWSSIIAVLVFVRTSYQDVALEMDLVRASTEALTAAMEAQLPDTKSNSLHAGSHTAASTTTTAAKTTTISNGIQKSYNFEIHDDIALSGYAGEVWEGLLQSAPKEQRNNLAVVEVGMHMAAQCLQAATEGYQTHCIEPSPKSFERITLAVKKAEPHVQQRVRLYNVAAGSEESTVPFVANGGTGDHVGEIDMWTMEKATKSAELSGGSQIIQVPSKPLDSVLGHVQETIHILKVDTQGFEPQVFSGLDQILAQKKAKYVMTEFWPRGMDVIAGKTNRECIGISTVLAKLVEHGYRLYALPAECHPKAPVFRTLGKLQRNRPLDDINKYCQWYYELEDQYPSEEYKMGYWTDFLAISSNAELPQILKDLPVY